MRLIYLLIFVNVKSKTYRSSSLGWLALLFSFTSPFLSLLN
uniref:Uncharacterized protein n=1 Tax=Heterorhabditis bacteriophora TaxID=37862 RepID=A0A1I7WTU1_HETBA